MYHCSLETADRWLRLGDPLAMKDSLFCRIFFVTLKAHRITAVFGVGCPLRKRLLPPRPQPSYHGRFARRTGHYLVSVSLFLFSGATHIHAVDLLFCNAQLFHPFFLLFFSGFLAFSPRSCATPRKGGGGGVSARSCGCLFDVARCRSFATRVLFPHVCCWNTTTKTLPRQEIKPAREESTGPSIGASALSLAQFSW